MEIKQMQELRNKTQHKIDDALHAFQEATGLKKIEVSVRHDSTSNNGVEFMRTEITAKL